MATHICGQCNQQFSQESFYLHHICPKTGFSPIQPEHLGPEFPAISQAALARGKTRKVMEGKIVNPMNEEDVISVIKKIREDL